MMKTTLIQNCAKDNPAIIEQINRPNKQEHRNLAVWSSDCAEGVLVYFEEKYPHDNRPRKAIEAIRAWARGEITVSQARAAAFAAHAAARDAVDIAAIAAARSAGHAAAVAHVRTHARYAATYAAKAGNAVPGNFVV